MANVSSASTDGLESDLQGHPTPMTTMANVNPRTNELESDHPQSLPPGHIPPLTTMASVNPRTNETEPNRLQALPPELQLRILDYINYEDAIRLSQTAKFYHHFVVPETWPHENKVAFIKNQQFALKHNRWIMLFDNTSSPFEMVCETDSLACYHCYRVKPRSMFSIRQSTKSRAKRSPKEEQPGFDRICIYCAWHERRWCAGTVFKIVTEQTMSCVNGFRMRAGVVRKVKQAQAVCGGCTCDVSISSIEEAMAFGNVTCKCCKHKTPVRKGPRYRLVGGNMLLAPCKLCSLETPTMYDVYGQKVKCCFCKEVVCPRCAVATGAGRDWWCGDVNCSTMAFSCAVWIAREKSRPLPGSVKAMLEKIEERKQRVGREKDVLAREECAEGILAVLGL